MDTSTAQGPGVQSPLREPQAWATLEQTVDHIIRDSQRIMHLASQDGLTDEETKRLRDAYALLGDVQIRLTWFLAITNPPIVPNPYPLDQKPDTIKELLILMRRYFISHNCPVGECVAWNELKRLYGVGQRDQDDEVWMRQHTGKPFTLRTGPDERPRRSRE